MTIEWSQAEHPGTLSESLVYLLVTDRSGCVRFGLEPVVRQKINARKEIEIIIGASFN